MSLTTLSPVVHPQPQQTASPGIGVPRFVVATSVSGTLLLAMGAFWLSFTTLRDLATLAGVPERQAWVWPLIVDGVILEATVSVVALRQAGAPARRFAWLLLGAGAGVSVAANISHAVVAADERVPALVAALVASIPPLVLVAMTHLSVELTRTGPTLHPAMPQASGRVEPESRTLPAAGRARRPSGASRRDPQRRQRAVALAAAGTSQRVIAAELGVHPTTVSRWLHAPDRQPQGDTR